MVQKKSQLWGAESEKKTKNTSNKKGQPQAKAVARLKPRSEGRRVDVLLLLKLLVKFVRRLPPEKEISCFLGVHVQVGI